MSIRLSLTNAEADALDRLFDAWLNTEEAWDIVPAIKRIRHKLNAAPVKSGTEEQAGDARG